MRGIIIEDIRFIDPASNNFRLALGSQLIDQGADISSWAIATDFYKKSRFRGLGYDIGAAEYQ
jgi:hypothetical protein